MKLKDIKDSWERDSAIDPMDLAGELYKISRLHSKYFNILTAEKSTLKIHETEFNKLKKIKRQYYLGRFSRRTLEELKWDPIDEEIKVSDLPDYLKGDRDLCVIQEKIDLQEIKIEFLKDIIKSIHLKGMNIKTAQSIREFEAGSTKY